MSESLGRDADAEARPPVPQYGQYASPEEQRARIRQPDATFSIDAGVAPAPTPAVEPAAAPSPVAGAAGRGSSADRIVTFGLLGFGLINVLLTVPSFMDLPNAASQSMELLGIPGGFTNFAQARTFGAIAAITLVVGWLVTTWASWRRLRKPRVTWWVPLVGAVVTYVVVYALLLPPIINDPAFMDYVRSAGG